MTGAVRGRRTESTRSSLGKRVTGFDPDALEDHRKRAESCKSGLQQIGADEHGEPKPIDTHKISERNAQKDHRARESHYQTIDAHRNILIALGRLITADVILLEKTNLASIDITMPIVYTPSVVAERGSRNHDEPGD